MKTIVITLAIITSALALAGTPDSMYVHFTASDNSDSMVVHAIANVDSIVYYAPVTPEPPETQGLDWDNITEGIAQADALTDADGKSYSAVKIGNQIWMAENLAYLPQVDYKSTFASATDARYSVYDYNGTNVNLAKANVNYSTYGVLYNWYAAMAGASSSNASPSEVQGICPSGWHLPSDAEWNTLITYCSTKYIYIANALKSTTGWSFVGSSWVGTDNKDFTALPGGYLYSTGGTFNSESERGYWWSSTQLSSSNAYYRYLTNNISNTVTSKNNTKLNGYSVRCLKD